MLLNQTNYKDKFTRFEKSLVGKALISLGNKTDVGFGYPTLGKGSSYNVGNIRIGYCTGYFTPINGNINNGLFVQVEFENPQGNDQHGYYQFGYVVSKLYKIITVAESADKVKEAQSFIDDLINCNKQIFENNLLCAGLISKAEKRGNKISNKHLIKLQELQTKLEQRNTELRNSSFLKTSETTPEGIKMYSKQLQDITNRNVSLGIIPVVMYIVGTAIITGLTSYIIYMKFKPSYSESKKDLVESQKLLKALATLSPKDKEEVLKDLEGQIDKAYIVGKMDGSGIGILKTISWAGAGLLGIILINSLIKK